MDILHSPVQNNQCLSRDVFDVYHEDHHERVEERVAIREEVSYNKGLLVDWYEVQLGMIWDDNCNLPQYSIQRHLHAEDPYD
jgi:hypothetical protein